MSSMGNGKSRSPVGIVGFAMVFFSYTEFSRGISFVWLISHILEVQSVLPHTVSPPPCFWSRGGADTTSGSSESTHETAAEVMSVLQACRAVKGKPYPVREGAHTKLSENIIGKYIAKRAVVGI